MDRDLKLNSIDRYVKSSPRFVLEEHGHCEVPAGCGGVVLRWRDPRVAEPVHLQVVVLDASASTVQLDGKSMVTSRPLLAPGRHTVTVSLSARAGAIPRLLFAARADGAPEGEWLLRSATDAGWRWTSAEPPEGWQDASFDDSGWRELVPAQLRESQRKDNYSVRRLLEAGAEPIQPSDWDRRLWLRAVFEVPGAEAGDGDALHPRCRAGGREPQAAGAHPAVLRVADL